jgi:diketogulonate reductase-like aldo/keto reductase
LPPRKRVSSESIGASNFPVPYLERIIKETGVVPAVNQVETHPLYQERQLGACHRRNRIHLEAYSPLGTGSVLKNETIGRIATKHSRSPAQVILKWHLQSGHIAIPKSVHPDRIRASSTLTSIRTTLTRSTISMIRTARPAASRENSTTSTRFAINRMTPPLRASDDSLSYLIRMYEGANRSPEIREPE